MSKKTIFECICDREIPGEFVYEDEEVMVIKDIHPAAPVHLLVIPKIAHPTLEDLHPDDDLPGKLIKVARQVAKAQGIDKNYKLMMNVGRQVQAVPHIHLHLLGGWAHPTPLTKAHPG
jgi:histidine triad (HIT) family protein